MGTQAASYLQAFEDAGLVAVGADHDDGEAFWVFAAQFFADLRV